MNGIHPTSLPGPYAPLLDLSPFPVIEDRTVIARLSHANVGDYLFYRPHHTAQITLAWKMAPGPVKIKIEHNENGFYFAKNDYLRRATFATPEDIVKANSDLLLRPLPMAENLINAIEEPRHFQNDALLYPVAERLRNALPCCYLLTNEPSGHNGLQNYRLIYRKWFGIGQACFTVERSSGLITLMEENQSLHLPSLEALLDHFNVKQSLLDVERRTCEFWQNPVHCWNASQEN